MFHMFRSDVSIVNDDLWMLDAHAHVMQVKLCKANTRGVTVLEPSYVRVPLCYLACCSTEFVGSCKMCNLLFFETRYNGKNLVF